MRYTLIFLLGLGVLSLAGCSFENAPAAEKKKANELSLDKLSSETTSTPKQEMKTPTPTPVSYTHLDVYKRQVDETFDLRFLNALIAHHEAGIVMTQDVRRKSSRGEVLDNADAVEAFLTGSASVLREWRANWYSVK